MVSTHPVIWPKKARVYIARRPMISQRGPPMNIARVNPQKAADATWPNWGGDSWKTSPSSVKRLALMAKVNAVTTNAMEHAVKSLDLFISFIDKQLSYAIQFYHLYFEFVFNFGH